jgi:hypothetical protein
MDRDVLTRALRSRSLRRVRLAWLIALAPPMCPVAGCGSLLGIGDLPGLEGGVVAAADSGGVTEDGSSSFGSSTSSGSASSSGGSSGSSSGGASSSGGSSSGSSDGSAIEGDDGGGEDCTPGATECVSETQVATCTTSGRWGTATTCTYACVGADDGGAGGNCGGTCVPGASQCSATCTPLECTAETCGTIGQWGAATTCPGGQCGSGQPGCCPCD